MNMTQIQHIWSGEARDEATARRMKIAALSWDREKAMHIGWTTRKFEIEGHRDATSIGDSVNLPFIHDMINSCVNGRGKQNIIFITNADIGVYQGISREIEAVCAEKGACFAYRWDFPLVESALVKKEEIAKGKWYVGCDAFAFTEEWWIANRDDIPDFVLGRECWDWITRAKIVETGGAELQQAIYHESHESPWKQNRGKSPGNVYNRSFARAWLTLRNLPLKEIAKAPFHPVVWPPAKKVEVVPATVVKKSEPVADGMDVLIVLGGGSKWQNQELKYCLRAIEKHAKNVRKVWVVGQNPGFLSAEVNMVERPDSATNKEHRIAEQIMHASKHLDITEHFLWINDDTFFLQDVDIKTYPYFWDGDLTNKWKRSKPNGYRTALMQTDAQLIARKFPNKNFEIHVPIIYSRAGMAKLAGWVNLSAKVAYGMTFRSVYCNVLGVTPGVQYKDMKLGSTQTADELRQRLSGRHVFSIGDGLGDGAKGYIDQLFPTKSKYEI